MVADGVGGWGDVDVDPGLFSKHLTASVNRLYEKGEPDQRSTLKNLLVESVKQNPHMGSSTAVMVKLKGKDELETCNLGDSAYLIVRPEIGG
jgi:protein phosphatase PTC7